MEAFDRLPADIRSVLNDAATKLGSVNTLHHRRWAAERGLPTSRTISKIRELEHYEIEVFAGRHMAQHGYALPHVKAEATILRYGSIEPTKPKRFGSPIFRPQHTRRRLRPRVIRLAKEAA